MVPSRAWYAFAAAFSLCKVHKEAGNLYHAGVLIHNDHTAGPDDGSGFFEGVKIQTKIQVFFRQTAAGRTAQLYGFEFLVVLDASGRCRR